MTLVRATVGIAIGLGVGIVSSLLGVAGGELLVPTFVFGYGADITTAGTASLLVSLPTSLVGVIWYVHDRNFPKPNELTHVALPMTLGSVPGAVAGTQLIGALSIPTLKAALGIILVMSAAGMLSKRLERR